MNDPSPTDEVTRASLRKRLLEQRDAYAGSAELAWASTALSQHLADVIRALRPRCLGGYWPIRSEFNPWLTLCNRFPVDGMVLALPWARKKPKEMVYRLWDGSQPDTQDECGIPSSNGREVEPDVLLVPCVGYTRTGWRLGYGGGYFDRYLSQRPALIAVGVAWACGELGVSSFEPNRHDRPLSVIVTERGVVRVG